MVSCFKVLRCHIRLDANNGCGDVPSPSVLDWCIALLDHLADGVLELKTVSLVLNSERSRLLAVYKHGAKVDVIHREHMISGDDKNV